MGKNTIPIRQFINLYLDLDNERYTTPVGWLSLTFNQLLEI